MEPAEEPPVIKHMNKMTVCFSGTGSLDRDKIDEIVRKVRMLGGSTRKEVSANVTHVVANHTNGAKYQMAFNYGIPIMTFEWIDCIWEHRKDNDFQPCQDKVIEQFKIKPFTGLGLAFIHVKHEDLKEMQELTVSNGGTVVEPNDLRCTHLIVDVIGEKEQINSELSKIVHKHQYVVNREWFWASLQVAHRSKETDKDFAFPVQGSKNFTRKSSSRLSHISHNSTVMSPNLDLSTSLDHSEIMKHQIDSAKKKPLDLASLTARHKVCLELLDTEKNYVNILNTIIKVFKEPLEQQEFGDILLDTVELKTIFGYLPPILEAHIKVFNRLEVLVDDWDEKNEIGKVFIDHYELFENVYPHYVNFFEKTKEMILECDKKYPRFHAFLKRCESKPECNRQSLKELLICPVQRLPRIVLLLNDLIKRTDKDNPDAKFLNQAVEKIKFVLDKINEGKRKTESQIAMFEIINDIDQCPADLLSSNRNLIKQVNIKLLKQEEEGISAFKNASLSMIVFNDLIEICKRRGLNKSNSLSLKNSAPVSVPTGNKKKSKKRFKHFLTIKFSEIKSLSTKEDSNWFVIVANALDGSRSFRYIPFECDDSETNKDKIMEILCTQMKVNHDSQENILQKVSLKSLDFTYANELAMKLSESKLSKITKGTKEKLTRTFSMKRESFAGLPLVRETSGSVQNLSTFSTPPPGLPPFPSPRNRRISRVFSQFISPLNNFSMRRIGSLTSLNENVEPSDNFSLPSTPAPRKKKCTNY